MTIKNSLKNDINSVEIWFNDGRKNKLFRFKSLRNRQETRTRMERIQLKYSGVRRVMSCCVNGGFI